MAGGDKLRMLRLALDLAPQQSNIRSEIRRLAYPVAAPHVLDDPRVRDHPISVGNQEAEKTEFGVAQRDALAGHDDFAPIKVNHHAAIITTELLRDWIASHAIDAPK